MVYADEVTRMYFDLKAESDKRAERVMKRCLLVGFVIGAIVSWIAKGYIHA